MENGYIVNASCLRYVVAFKYAETFEDAIEKVEAQQLEKKNETKSKWQRRLSDDGAKNGPESDLYSYVRNEYRFDNDTEGISEQKSGCEWLYCENVTTNKARGFKELVYFPKGLKEKDEPSQEELWDISLTNLGLSLFRNGVGFVWYEIRIPKNADSNWVKTFQNKIRELNRPDSSLVWEKYQTNIKQSDDLFFKEGGNGYDYYLRTFSFGEWVNSVVGFLDVTFFSERKSTSENIRVPDKPLLFTYLSLGNGSPTADLSEKYSIVYHITNGYKDTYHFSEEIVSDIRKPFDDSFWYATKEGVAYITWPKQDNMEVFNTAIINKYTTDYFSLYLKVLYQSFSLLLYAEKIQAEISAVNRTYLVMPFDERITDLFGEINLFLAKSMATSVSHIHHQSEFYIYLKERLRVHDDVKSVTSGLNALDVLQREQKEREESKRIQEELKEEQRRDREAQEARDKQEEREKESDRKIQGILIVFTLLGIFSALVDWFDFIYKFAANKEKEFEKMGPTGQYVVIGGIVTIIVVTIAALLLIIRTIKSSSNTTKKKVNNHSCFTRLKKN